MMSPNPSTPKFCSLITASRQSLLKFSYSQLLQFYYAHKPSYIFYSKRWWSEIKLWCFCVNISSSRFVRQDRCFFFDGNSLIPQRRFLAMTSARFSQQARTASNIYYYELLNALISLSISSLTSSKFKTKLENSSNIKIDQKSRVLRQNITIC